ncbi:MAG: peroxiredoxin-like family protein [Trueperaceae bacterium]|nr:peroxiredoxin-like family protein [Trueperaceae bacterium]
MSATNMSATNMSTTPSTINTLIPRQPVPSLDVPTVGGGRWRLGDAAPDNFTLVVFYRGRHCPVCSKYMRELERLLPDFSERGVEVVGISSDGAERAESAKTDWKLDNLTVGYDLSLDKAREWGLFISSGKGKSSTGHDEPALFSEPALYLVRPDGTLYFGAVQTMPFARPHFEDIVQAVDFVLSKDYPARGEVLDHRAATV